MKRLHIGGIVALAPPRGLDFLALAKPELTLMSVLTAVGGAFLGMTAGSSLSVLFWTFAGTLSVGAGAGALNMALEHAHDARMTRTRNRPIPAGRLSPLEAAIFGLSLSVLGVGVLFTMTNALAALLAAITLVTYLFLYTPLKRLTPFATIVGAVPGALPPVIGWAAARGEIGLSGWAFFAILFFWQVPHFLSLSWLYRKDYENAGYRLLSVVDKSGVIVRRQILIFSFTLLPASLLPVYTDTLGSIYFLGASFLSGMFLLTAFRSMNPLTHASARKLFLASLAYLPALIFLMAIDKVSG